NSLNNDEFQTPLCSLAHRHGLVPCGHTEKGDGGKRDGENECLPPRINYLNSLNSGISEQWRKIMMTLRVLTRGVDERKYQQQVLDVEMGSFTPLVFRTNGRMGNECQRFLKRLAGKIAQKDTEPYHVVITWLRTQISFELLRSVHACVRGSRTPF
ncbi:unnamed protein product, partial [Porites lobata]